MNIALLSRQPDLYANKRLTQEAQKNGCSLAIVDPLSCSLLVQDSGICLIHPQYAMSDFDGVLPRFGPTWQRQGNTVLQQLERQGAVSLNGSTAIATARNKFHCLQLFQQNNLAIPKSASVGSIQQLDHLMHNEFSFPVLLKQDSSSQGRGVTLFHSKDDMLIQATALLAQNEAFTLQEFISEASGMDLRLFVINQQVIASMKRIAPAGEFRANIHLGGRAESYAPSPQEERLALHASALLGLDVAGVDVIYSNNGPLLLEVNACPGFEALERITGLNVAGKMLDFMISQQYAK